MKRTSEYINIFMIVSTVIGAIAAIGFGIIFSSEGENGIAFIVVVASAIYLGLWFWVYWIVKRFVIETETQTNYLEIIAKHLTEKKM